jgi:DNA polymerase-1
VIAQRLAAPVWAALDGGARRAFKIGNATVPAVAGMRIAGLPFDRTAHAAAIADWEARLVGARDAFVQIAAAEVPPAGPQRCAWLEAQMPPEMLSWWPRTDTGLLRTRSADLDRLAAVPEIRPLLEVISLDKRLRGFGHTLLARVGPDGRLHMDLRPAATKTGRCSCSQPNLQQMPQEVRRAVIAPAGRRVHAALEALDARLLLQIHDELLVECAAPIAATVEALLVEHMTAAWLELFPDGPTRGLVDTAVRCCWAKPEE